MTLEDYYNVVFSLVQHHKYSVTEIEDMMPFERDLYTSKVMELLAKIEEEKKKRSR